MRAKYAIVLPKNEVRKRGITPLYITNQMNRNYAKVTTRKSRFVEQVSKHENLSFKTRRAGKRGQHLVGDVYLMLTNKRDASKLAREYGLGSEGYMTLTTPWNGR